MFAFLGRVFFVFPSILSFRLIEIFETYTPKKLMFSQESPFKDMQAPTWMQPFVDCVYWAPSTLAKKLGKDADQGIYFVGSFLAIACSFYLKSMKGETQRKVFCLVAGLCINFFVFGISASVGIAQNLLAYLIMVTLPSAYQHRVVFVSSAIILAMC